MKHKIETKNYRELESRQRQPLLPLHYYMGIAQFEQNKFNKIQEKKKVLEVKTIDFIFLSNENNKTTTSS